MFENYKQSRREIGIISLTAAAAFFSCDGSGVSVSRRTAALAGESVITPTVPLELPVEIETELAPAGSLKHAPLWHEVAQLLDNPGAISCPDPTKPNECVANIERRQSFGTTLPPLKVWSPCFNVLTGQPLRLRTSDGGISWDQPGLLFGPDDGDPTTALDQVIGNLVVDEENRLVVSNPTGSELLPPDGEIVAVPGCNAEGQPIDLDGEVITEFEKPISELDFLRARSPEELSAVPAARRPYVGRVAAQALGKALFWDMQVGSDGVQACGTCHFHAGVDNRTKNQLNPNHLGGDVSLQLHGGVANRDLTTGDFPFHKLANPNVPGEPLLNSGNVISDTNDVASSMGVRFRKFADIPPIGGGSFGPPSVGGVRPLLPDVPVSENEADPIPVFQGLRRVEPRNTPTIMSTAFNFDNFWDGRARHDANGGSVFGPADPQFHIFIDPGPAGTTGDSAGLEGTTNGHIRPDLLEEDPDIAEQPVRIRFSSLASLATGPALSEFEMSFLGRNWAKIGKKLLQGGVTPLANQLVSPTDSVLGPFSNQPGNPDTVCNKGPQKAGKPGLCVSYEELIELAFRRDLWHNQKLNANKGGMHLRGIPAPCDPLVPPLNGALTPADCDPFDGYRLVMASGPANQNDRNQFRQIEANFSLFFGMSVQIWQQLLIPDDTPFDRFIDANPQAANAVGQPGEQGTLPPDRVRALVTGSPTGTLNMVPGFGPDEIFGFDIFSGANLTAALPTGSPRNPTGVGSNPFLRTGRCMLCHLGPEQTDHTNNVNAGLIHSDTEFELPPPGEPEPTGQSRTITGPILAEEVEENAQDGVEVENRNFAVVDDPATPFDERVIGSPNGIAFQDNGVYNIGVRPTSEDVMRGGRDAFGWPLSLAAMAMKNLAGPDFEPCDRSTDLACAMPNFDPEAGPGGGLFEETGADQRINPGLDMEPAEPLLPAYLAPWANNLPAGELHPEIDELAFAPNTLTEPPFAEFLEILFGADTNCATYDPILFGNEPPNLGWGPTCPNSQSAIPNNMAPTMNGTFPVQNRVARMGAVKAPQLRNVELTGPYFHTGSYLTLRQVVDFYMRGGDFPVTNAEDRDPNLVVAGLQAFGFGTTIGLPDQFQDGVPDQITQYRAMPDTTSATPEYATPEDATVSLVKFLLTMTDARVKFERAPFDHPEIIVPVDGTAPDNVGGRAALVADPRFKVIPAVGAAGSATPLKPFLGITTNAAANCTTEISHFCR
jgi:hypothetical protein